MILVPDVVLDVQDRFLDNVTLHDIKEALGIPVRKISSTPEGLIERDFGNNITLASF